MLTDQDVLPLAMVRAHCKLDDVPSVSDSILELYRAAAIEAAEQYTGLTLRGERYRTVDISVTARDRRTGKATIRLPEPSADGILVILGGATNTTVSIGIGATTAQIPVFAEALDASACCGGCNRPINQGYAVRYKVGFCRAEDIPYGIRLGMLKFIAWTVENPGDRLVTVNDRSATTSSQGISGTNNAAWASGAIEQWRQYVNRVSP